jgi:glutamate-1-semialdehyde aminotransferase
MPSRYSNDSVLTESERIARVWTDNPTFSLGEVTLAAFQAKITEARQKREQLETLRMQVTALSNDLETRMNELASIRTRALSGVRAVFGPNSTQYEQAGGKRQSEIRRSSRKGGGTGGSD